MNEIQLKQFKERLEILSKFTQDKNQITYKESKIIDWISDCINLFYEIGVDSIIIRNFLDHFRSKTERVEYDYMGSKKEIIVNAIGPFQEEMTGGMFHHKTGNYILSGSFYYAKVAFSSARNVLKNKTLEKRIVPFWLIEQTSLEDSIKHLSPSLELIENKYEDMDAQGLIIESNTLLDSVLNLDSELRTKKDIGTKLSSLRDNDLKRESFGVSRDIIIGLNCGRILRNVKVIHKNTPIKYEFPFLISTSFAYLVLHFVECAILNGKGKES